jgi:signal transduction histidine kinase
VQEKQQQRIARTLANIDRLLKLIDELLDIEKLASGKLVDELTPCAVNNIVKGAVNAVRDHAELQKLTLTSQDSDGTVLADEQRLIQVVVNLLTNAIKYSPANTTIAVEQADLGQDIEIRVVDQGRGLPANMHERIFESYVQVQKSDAKRGTGTGLGLAICKQIVEKHGGTIGVISEEGKGSCFWIRLPKIRVDAKSAKA